VPSDKLMVCKIMSFVRGRGETPSFNVLFLLMRTCKELLLALASCSQKCGDHGTDAHVHACGQPTARRARPAAKCAPLRMALPSRSSRLASQTASWPSPGRRCAPVAPELWGQCDR